MPGTGDIETPQCVYLSVRPSVHPSVTFSFRTVTPIRIAVFSRNFAGTCTISWGCAVVFEIGILFDFFNEFCWGGGLFTHLSFFLISCFLRIFGYFQHF